MLMRCIEQVQGFTVGKLYKLVSGTGEYIQLKDDSGHEVLVYGGNFKVVKGVDFK